MAAKERRVVYYVTAAGEAPAERWLEGLKDGGARRKLRVRFSRLAGGNFGDHRMLDAGLVELRLALGPGYRAYCGLMDEVLVLLLCGGTKATQDQDIRLARDYWRDARRRHGD